ncbi:hypothetical protein JNK13_04555 [bacterium]|nr:hypothetical protein [bacterium]
MHKIIFPLILVFFCLACSSPKPRVIVVRSPQGPTAEQIEIDELRRKQTEESILGQQETKPWNERYLGEEPSEPYQGPTPK